MRPFEILLSLANCLAVCMIALPKLRIKRWMGYVAPITMLLAGLQILVEGFRWEMIPAYALTSILFFIWLLRIVKPGNIPVHRFLAGTGAGLAILVLATSIALPTVLPIFRFPQPAGPYQIGTVTYHWVEDRHEIFSTDPHAQRQIMAQIWYPVKGDHSSTRAPYLQDASALSSALALTAHLPGFTFDQLQYVTTNAIPSAPVATNQPGYPVLIFLTGLTGFRQSNTFQVENLVSYGYIVVGIDQPYTAAVVTFPNGQQITGWTRDRMQPLIQQSLSPVANAPTVNGQVLTQGIIPYLAQDVSFTLDQLTALNKADPNGLLNGRLDLQHVGAFGVSLGAMIAGEACHTDARLRACLMMDAAMPADVVQAGLRQPAMWLTRPASFMQLEHWAPADITQTLDTMQAVYQKSQPGDGYYVSIAGMFHVNFTDAPLFTPLAPQLGFAGPIDGQRGFAIINAYSLAFFNHSLEGQQAGLLDGPAQQYPEVLFATH